jgi:organic hydroperoxide reductase OsmC/OhrA
LPKRFEYSATGDVADDANAEELVLAALVRCSLTSLAFFAEQEGLKASGRGAADGIVTKREDDGRFAFTDIECGFDVEVEPAPDAEALGKLLDSAEWGCFIGASLTVKPRYEWRVNGEVVAR